jgi:branched-chain amino acid transport system substrate-binding protein
LRILNLFLSAAIGLLIVQLRFVPQALAQPTQPIRIGVLDEITGPVATSGLALLIGVKLAVQEINASGGILGRQVEIVVADNQSDPTKSVGEAQRLASVEKVDAIIGPNTSPSNLAVAPIFTAAKLFQISQAGSLQMTPQRVP